VVLDVDDRSDVVQVESADPGSDGEKGASLDGSVVRLSGGCWVSVTGQAELSFDRVNVAKPLLEGGQGLSGEVRQGFRIWIERGDEVLGP
jgi:hypothetical protein